MSFRRQPPPCALPMSCIADFDVVRELGEGGFGRVWLVKEKANGELYAMKVQEKKRLVRKRSVARAISEKDCLARLANPFIIKLVYAFQTKAKLCLVLEYVGGGTLGELQDMMPGKFLDEGAVRFAVSELIVALEYIHGIGIIYRDMKPENIREFLGHRARPQSQGQFATPVTRLW